MHNLKIWNYLSIPWLVFTLTFFIIFFLLAFLVEIDSSYLSKNYLNKLFLNTVILSFGSAILSAIIAVPLAILVTFYKFPGHRFFSWSLSLSIAFPAYVYAFIYVGIFEYASPISEYLRNFNITLPQIKNIYGASVIMSMALFPYIFLLTKAHLRSVGIKSFKAAKSLGNNNITAIRKVIIPSLWPTIIAGMALVVFETIADFGGVSTLRIETFTVGIYDAWFGYQSYFSATRLAGYLLIFVFLIMFLAKYFGEKSSNLASKTAETFQRIETSPMVGLGVLLFCSFVFIIVFCLPTTQLIIWNLSDSSSNILSNLQLLINSSIVGLLASVITVFFAIALALSYKHSNILKSPILISSSGYAIPGSVISAGLLVGVDYVFNTSITFYGILGLIVCLSLRFMTPAFNYISASLSNISRSAENALTTQPKNSFKAFKLFYFPHMKPAIFLSLMLVFIESIKEQPATLLLRPIGFDTLSTKIYNFTSEGQWEMAAAPSLFLVSMSLIFIYLINKNIDLNQDK